MTLHTSAKRLIETYRDWSQHQERIMHVDYDTTWTYSDFITWFRECLNDKINREDTRNWRKFGFDYQVNLRRDQDSLRDIHKRIRVYQLHTSEIRSRFSYLLSHYDD